jgi:hypothetical protein
MFCRGVVMQKPYISELTAENRVMSIFISWAEKQTNLSPVFNKGFMGKPQIVARNLL